MGVTGLLPILKSIRKPQHIRVFARQRVGVDAYGWLHKGTYTCASQLCRGVDTDAYVHYCMHRVRMLIHFGITPVLVFDGAALPMKSETHLERQQRRDEALQKAEQALARGNHKLAEECYQRACAVTPEMARKLIRECRKINVEYVVAPYEADAQLAWMVQTGYVEAVITEDSDLLVYGASKVFYKMTKTGDGDMYEMKNLPSLTAVNMFRFTEDMFLYMCVCAGCDFFKGIKGMGLKKSHAMVKRFQTMTRLTSAIRHDRRWKVSSSFVTDFARACLVFRHQTVFDILRVKTVPLTELNDVVKARLPPGVLGTKEGGELELSFLGDHRDPPIAQKIAQGLVHPSTLVEYDDPLDLVQRPVQTRARPLRFPDPAPTQNHSKQTGPKVLSGFQVLQARSRPDNSSTRTPNLRQRLTTRSRGFNPRRVAAKFKANNSLSTTRTPNFSPPPNSIWNSFRANQPGQSENEGITAEANGGCSPESTNEERSDSESEENCNLRQNRKRLRSPDLDDTTSDDKADENEATCNEQAAKRAQAVSRAVSRFAIEAEEDQRLKFVPRKKPKLDPRQALEENVNTKVSILDCPPSPDENAYSLFEEIDAEPPVHVKEPPDHGLRGKQKRNPVKKKKKRSSRTGQVLLSRFFPNPSSTLQTKHLNSNVSTKRITTKITSPQSRRGVSARGEKLQTRLPA